MVYNKMTRRRTAKQVYEEFLAERRDAVIRILKARAWVRDLMKEAHPEFWTKRVERYDENPLLRHELVWNHAFNTNGCKPRMPHKPTLPYLEEYYADLKIFAEASYGPITLSDGYSCSGEEDARAENQFHAGEKAKELRYAILYLKSNGRRNHEFTIQEEY